VEAFECLEGELEIEIDGRTTKLQPGSFLTASRNQLHAFRNISHAPAVVRVIATPGAEAEYSLRVAGRLTADGYGPRRGGGSPKDLLVAVVFLHRVGYYFPPLPRSLFRALVKGVAAFGRWRGRERLLIAMYPEYGRLLDSLNRHGSTPSGLT
jgi:hypothetical protein